MKAIKIKDNKIYLEVLQGVPFSFALDSEQSEWGSYEDLALEVKGRQDLNFPPIIKLTLTSTDQGSLVIEGTRLRINFEASAFVKNTERILYWDLKGKKGGAIIPIVPGEIRINNTVTKI